VVFEGTRRRVALRVQINSARTVSELRAIVRAFFLDSSADAA
jgi:hypothetical protein